MPPRAISFSIWYSAADTSGSGGSEPLTGAAIVGSLPLSRGVRELLGAAIVASSPLSTGAREVLGAAIVASRPLSAAGGFEAPRVPSGSLDGGDGAAELGATVAANAAELAALGGASPSSG